MPEYLVGLNQKMSTESSRPLGSVKEERVLIGEVLVRTEDGEELVRKDLESKAVAALKASRPNSALTVREVHEDVRRIINSSHFCSCLPVAVDTRDGIRLMFQGVEPNQEFQGLECEGANVLPAKFLQDQFRNGYGKVVNIWLLDDVITSVNGWYMERGLFGLVSDDEILLGILSRCRFQKQSGEPTVGKTKPETILRQLTTKKGQVYSMLQGKRDVEAMLTVEIVEDVSIIPQSAFDAAKVDLTMNCVERVCGGFSPGGGISSGLTSGPLSGLIGRSKIKTRKWLRIELGIRVDSPLGPLRLENAFNDKKGSSVSIWSWLP